MGYSIYHVRYGTGWAMNEEAIIATNSEEKIPVIVEKHVREDIGISEISRKAKDIGFRVLGFLYTEFKADKEGIIGYSLDELIIKIKTRKD